jgi:hypothetical protein
VNVVAAVVAAALFVVAFRLFRVWAVAADVLAVTRRAAAVMADGRLGDDAKEREIRAASKRLMGRSVEVTGRVAAVLGVPAAVLLGFDALGLASLDEVLALFLRWDVIVAGTVVPMVLIGLRRR